MYHELMDAILSLADGRNTTIEYVTLYRDIKKLNAVEMLEFEKELAIRGYRLIMNHDEESVNIKETELLEEVIKLRAKYVKSTAARQLSDKATVKIIFSLYVDNRCSLNDVVEYLIKNEYKTYKGGSWYRGSVKLILQNESYVDLGYVTREQFVKAGQLLQEKRKNKTRNNGNGKAEV